MKQLAILLIFLFSFNTNSECVYGDCVNGYGRIIYDDGEYSGKFKNGIRSGQGIYIWSNEGRYEGDWKNGRKHGFGIQEWFNVPVDNGSIKYIGEYNHGIKIRGTLFFKDGNGYTGEFKNNLMHGKGVWIYPDGRKLPTITSEGEIDLEATIAFAGELISKLKERCNDLGFTDEINIIKCVEREIKHDIEIEQQKYELQLAANKIRNQETQIANLEADIASQKSQKEAQKRLAKQATKKKEWTAADQRQLERRLQREARASKNEVPWMLRFLGDVLVGVSEGMANPNNVVIQNQARQQQINNQRRREILKNTAPPKTP